MSLQNIRKEVIVNQFVERFAEIQILENDARLCTLVNNALPPTIQKGDLVKKWEQSDLVARHMEDFVKNVNVNKYIDDTRLVRTIKQFIKGLDIEDETDKQLLRDVMAILWQSDPRLVIDSMKSYETDSLGNDLINDLRNSRNPFLVGQFATKDRLSDAITQDDQYAMQP